MGSSGQHALLPMRPGVRPSTSVLMPSFRSALAQTSRSCLSRGAVLDAQDFCGLRSASVQACLPKALAARSSVVWHEPGLSHTHRVRSVPATQSARPLCLDHGACPTTACASSPDHTGGRCDHSWVIVCRYGAAYTRGVPQRDRPLLCPGTYHQHWRCRRDLRTYCGYHYLP